jgi:hypothetical protein
MNRQKIEEVASRFGVDTSWAINTRLRYLRGALSFVHHQLGGLSKRVLLTFDTVGLQLLGVAIENWEKKKRSLQYQIQYLKCEVQPALQHGITTHDVEHARNYPIHVLLGVELSKRVRCPFHDDHHPSASIKNNKLHCWVCNKTWDGISYVMETKEVNFIEAIKYINGIEGKSCQNV